MGKDIENLVPCQYEIWNNFEEVSKFSIHYEDMSSSLEN
jgi:hypothetical protein